MPSAPNKLPALCAIAGAALFSSKVIFAKIGFNHGVSPEALMALRMSFALPFFLCLLVWTHIKATSPLPLISYLSIAATGLIGYYLASYLDFLGTVHISAGMARMLIYTYPSEGGQEKWEVMGLGGI